MTDTIQPVAKAQMLIRRPVAQVFEALIDPAITSRFWFSKGSGRLEAGKRVRWDWEMYGASADVDVKAIERDKRILIEWDGPESPTAVEWTFEPVGEDCTYVTVKNWGFGGDQAAAVAAALDSTGGFSFLLAGLKAFLEHGIELNLVLDHAPAAHVPGWTPAAPAMSDIDFSGAAGNIPPPPAAAQDPGEQMVFDRVAFHDPNVLNIEGASLLAPAGWQVEGGFHWMPLYSMQANFHFTATDPGTGAAVYTLPFQQFRWSLQGMPVGMGPGSNWLGSVVLPPPGSAAEFVQMFYLPGPLRHLQAARLVKAEDLPRYAAELGRPLGPQRTVRATRLRYAYEWGGRGWEEDVYITLIFDPPSAIPRWWGSGHAMRAPAGELDRMTPVLSVPIQSMRLSLDWSATLELAQNMFTQTAAGVVVDTALLAARLRDHREEMRQMHRQTWEERHAAQARQSFALREVLGGVETVVNPFESRTVELPAGYSHRWVNPQGQVILSNNPHYDPRQGSTLDWRQMERYTP